MLRIRFIWRVALILVAALVVVQLFAAGAYYVQRDRATKAGFHLPLPDQIAALVQLLDHATPEQAALALRAVNGAGLRVDIRSDRPSESESDWHLQRIEAALASYLGGGDRFISARLIRADAAAGNVREQIRSVLAGKVRVIVSLASGGYLVVETADELMARLFGLPAGFWAGIVGFVVVALAILAIARETRPLSRLAGSVERFGAALEPVPMPEKGAPEMRALIGAVNRMQSRIATLVKSRTFVLGAISHDLRTYLTRLRLRVETLPQGTVRERVVRDVEDMQALVEEALAFAHATFVEPKKQPIDLGQIVARECEERTAMGASVTFDAPPQPVIVAGTAATLGRVVANIVDNAVKYGGQADVAVATIGPSAEITVDDRGPGIPPGERERIFEPFRRLEDSRNREKGGAGLGLAIARQIAEIHGGTIAVEDRTGGGARFRVQLPRFVEGAA
jgi:two-component system, OmpR family, osmolarity sensor histidine kinase EnvZ